MCGYFLSCQACGVEMDIINQTPRLQVNVCCQEECGRYGAAVVSENIEYQERILPERVGK